MKAFIRIILVLSVIMIIPLQIYSQGNTAKFHKNIAVQSDNGPASINTNSPYSFPKSGNIGKANTNIITQDFSSTTFPPTGWTASVISGPLNWTRATALALAYDNLNDAGTTFTNGYAIANSDGVGSGQPAENCALRSPVINCASYTNVWLSFNEYFRQYSASTGHVEVSTNGTSWTTVYSAETGLAQNQSTANPHFVDINLTSYAAGQATFYVRFHWTGNWDYYWVVDDIAVYTRPNYDAALIDRTNMNEYTAIPKLQYTPSGLTLSATAKNLGASTLTNVNMGVKVYNGDTWAVLHNVTSNTVASLTANSTATLTATAYTPPSGAGFYVAEYIVHCTQTDADASNDTIIQAFWVSDSIYARDDAIFFSTLDGSLGTTTSASILGQNYTVNAADRLKSVAFYVTGAVTGDQTQVVVYSTTNGLPVTQLAASPLHTFTTTAAQWVDLPISGGAYALTPGTYFIGIRQISTTNNIGLAYTNYNYTPLKVYAKIGTDPWDTLSNFGYNISFIIRPALVCGAYKPIITAPQNFVCTGDQLTLTSSPGTNYIWNPGGQNTQSVNITAGGSYTVSVTSNDGCSALSNPFAVAENPKPTVALGPDMILCADQNITLNAGGPYTNYAWSTGAATQQIQVDTLGHGMGTQTISVVVTNNGCINSDTISITFDPCTGIEESNIQPASIFPNPVSDVLKLNFSMPYSGNLIIVNTSGQQLFNQYIDIQYSGSISVPIKSFGKGLFYLLLQNEKLSAYKFIIE